MGNRNCQQARPTTPTPARHAPRRPTGPDPTPPTTRRPRKILAGRLTSRPAPDANQPGPVKRSGLFYGCKLLALFSTFRPAPVLLGPRLPPTQRRETSNQPQKAMTNKLRITKTPEAGKWSGKESIPAIGQTVQVSMNGIGPSTVLGFFTEDGWLGLYVQPHNPPEWYVRQNGGACCCHVFGAELKRPEPVTA